MKTKQINLKHSKDGFTLIELILYISITGVIMLLASVMFLNLLEARTKQQVINEVEQQGMHVMHRLSRAVRNAEAINLPEPNTTSSNLSLQYSNAAANPTQFNITNGTLNEIINNQDPVQLHNSRVLISDFTVTNLSAANTPGTVQYSVTISYINPENISSYDYQETFTGSATIRDN